MDYAAATPIHKKVKRLMEQIEHQNFANPGAIHTEGRAVKAILENARLRLARVLTVRPEEVLFTGSGTESNNIAIQGIISALETNKVAIDDMSIITTQLEHPSVSKVLEKLKAKGVNVKLVDVDNVGKIDIDHFIKLLDKKVKLVTFSYANSEIGVVQDVRKLSKIVRRFNQENKTTIKIHLDASQAPLWLSCQVPSLGVDIMTLDAGKCNGPKGVGVLIKKRAVDIDPILYGGGQEAGLRSGTENFIAIAGAVEAIILAQADYKSKSKEILKTSGVLWSSISAIIPEAIWNGPSLKDVGDRLPNNVHISLPGYDTEFTAVELDNKGVAVSTKSACSGAGGGESTAVKAISGDAVRAQSTLRFTLDPNLKPTQVKKVSILLRQHLDKMKPYLKVTK